MTVRRRRRQVAKADKALGAILPTTENAPLRLDVKADRTATAAVVAAKIANLK
ncbi:hypothetical protein O164_11705 [Pseudomonas taiwanensis SJ9]|uniref:Uncharacterized protein n=1 Tax=Pseudomonas taiwanensis SJ9 TaxID=1388762 RepID=V7DE56_9PSED|nr:hypothetical protein O164_11705 [Pseudomonas taiwanensis SJ9]